LLYLANANSQLRSGDNYTFKKQQQVTQASWLALPFWGGVGEVFKSKTFLGNNFVI
jgi:hypothetical protein